MRADRRITTRQIEEELKISSGTVNAILHEKLGLRKLKTKWVPRNLRDDQKACRVELSKVNLTLLNRDSTDFWRRLITVDETWVHYFTPENAEASRRWTFPGEQPTTSVRRSPSAGKIMATIFWDAKGIILIDYLQRGTTINGEYYAFLLEKMVAKVRESRPSLQRKKILLLHDNAPAHTAKVVTQKIQELHLQTVPHPPYSPDLAPSDFFLFERLKNSLAGTTFERDEEVVMAVNGFFDNKTSDFFSNGIKQLVDRWTRCIDNLGEYFE